MVIAPAQDTTPASLSEGRCHVPRPEVGQAADCADMTRKRASGRAHPREGTFEAMCFGKSSLADMRGLFELSSHPLISV